MDRITGIKPIRHLLFSFLVLALCVPGFLLAPASPAQASTPSVNNKLFFVADNTGTGNKLFTATSTAASVQAATTLPSGTAMNGLYRSLATDGTYLYFSDGTDLVRTALDGTSKTTIASGVAYPEQIAISGNYIYYSRFSLGIYSVPKSGGASTQILTSAANYGWDGVTVTSTTLYAANYTDGLYTATLNGTGGITGTATLNSDAGMKSLTKLAASGSTLYAASGTTSKIWKTTDTSLARSSWESIDILSATASNPYSLAIAGSTMYFTTGAKQVGQVQLDGSSASLLSSAGQFSTSSYGITAIPKFSVTYNANTGGTGAPTDPNSPYSDGTTVTVASGSGVTKPNYRFFRWNTLQNGNGTNYDPGGTFAISEDTTLWARWIGGPLEFRTSASGAAISSATFPNTVLGQTSSITVHVRNTGPEVWVAPPTLPSNVTVTNKTCPENIGPTYPSMQTYDGTTVLDCTYTLRWSAATNTNLSTTFTLSYGSSDAITLTGTVVTAGRTPTFDTPVPTTDGYTVNVTNWDSSWAWTATVNSGTVTVGTGSGTTLPLTITGLGASTSATVTVNNQRSSYADGTATTSGTSNAAATPTSSASATPTSSPAAATSTTSQNSTQNSSETDELGDTGAHIANLLPSALMAIFFGLWMTNGARRRKPISHK